jgi:hypothetical protein
MEIPPLRRKSEIPPLPPVKVPDLPAPKALGDALVHSVQEQIAERGVKGVFISPDRSTIGVISNNMTNVTFPNFMEMNTGEEFTVDVGPLQVFKRTYNPIKRRWTNRFTMC